MEFYHFIVNFFRDGGFFLYPLAAIFVVGVAIAIERFIYLSIETTSNRRLWGQVVPLINAGNFKQVVAITSKSQGRDRHGAELRHRAARQRAPAR